MPASDRFDIALLGGGLAGGLIALALAERRPNLRVALFEAESQFGGNHVWSFFDTDIFARDRPLVDPLVCHRWSGYDVAFPAHRRTLQAGYNSIESDRLDAVLRERLPTASRFTGKAVRPVPGGVAIDDAETIAAATVIDTRGAGDAAAFDAGWQKFVGMLLHVDAPHGLERPIVMDATVAQIDGYRFVYVLPFSPTSLFVEDTYYSDSPALDVERVKARIFEYAAARGWQVTPGNRIETGVLPVVVAGDFDAYWSSTGEGAKAGMRAGLFHPTTGFSLPDAVRLASAIADAPDLSQAALDRLTRDHAARAWKARGFYRMLDTMLFRAAYPHERYRIMERFYRLPQPLIERFYAAKTTRYDVLRILTGKPPIPIPRALAAILRTRR